jgi:hypothetical protein
VKRIGSLEGESNPWEYRLRVEQQCSSSMTDSSVEQSLEVGAIEREGVNFSEWILGADQTLTARGPSGSETIDSCRRGKDFEGRKPAW